MSDQEKFAGFQEKLIDDNEKRYGREIRAKYGDETVNRANKKIKNMTEEQYAAVEKLRLAVNESLDLAIKNGDPAGETAQAACALHREWLQFHWPEYSKEAHMALVQMYVDDPRFSAYYEKIAPGATVFLRDAMRIFTGVEESRG